jgi:hypothetical protein
MYEKRSLRTVILLAAVMCLAGIIRFYGGELELVKQKHFVRANGYVLKVGKDLRQRPP